MYHVRTMDQRVDESLARRRFSMLLLGVFASVALVLATIGIYGVMAYLVNQGTRELGIRIALGASQRNILNLVVRQGMALAVSGVTIGLARSLPAHAADSKPAVRRERDGPNHVRWDLLLARDHRDARLLHPGPTRRANRSASIAALRLEPVSLFLSGNPRTDIRGDPGVAHPLRSSKGGDFGCIYPSLDDLVSELLLPTLSRKARERTGHPRRQLIWALLC